MHRTRLITFAAVVLTAALLAGGARYVLGEGHAGQSVISGMLTGIVVGLGGAVLWGWRVNRARAEDLQRQSRDLRRLSQIAGHTDHAVAFLDGAGLVEWVNPAFYRVTGYVPGQAIGRRWLSLVQGTESAPETVADLIQALRERRRWAGEFQAQRADGESLWCSVEITPLEGGEEGFLVLQSDIDRRRLVEEELKREKDLLSGVMATSPEGVVVMQAVRELDGIVSDFVVQLANQSAEHSIGRGRGALSGRRLRDLFPGALAAGLFDRLVAVAEAGDTLDCEYAHAREGQQAWLRLGARRLGDGCLLTITDVTRLKVAEERFRAIFDQSGVAYFLQDERGIFDCNEALIGLLGFQEKSEVLHRHPCDFSPEVQPDGRASRSKSSELEQQAREGARVRYDWVFRRAEGSSFTAEVALAPVKFAGGTALLGVWRDLTENQEVERALASSEERLKLALESSDQALWEYNPQTGELISDSKYARLFGFGKDEVEQALMVWEASLNAALRKHKAQAMQGSHEVEYLARKQTGEMIWIATRGRVVDRDERGHPVRMIGTIQDISQRKAIERQLRDAKEKAEAADRAKSSFLAVMSHEIRTPMNGVIGLTNYLSETALDAQQRECVDTILSSAEALLSLINDILDFSKIESRQLELERHPFWLRKAMEDVLGLQTQGAAQKGLDLLLHYSPEVPEWVVGDISRVRQVLANLVGNATKFTARGEVELGVAPAPAQPGDRPGLLRLRFTVRDTGIGIPTDKLDRLFRPFSQADSSTTRRFGGTGLGLAICKRLVELMGGTIGVRSEPGKGSVFSFEIPLERPASAAAPLLSPKQVQIFQGCPLAVLHPHSRARELLGAQLGQAGFTVRTYGVVSDLVAALASGEKASVLVADLGAFLSQGALVLPPPTLAEMPALLISCVGDERMNALKSAFPRNGILSKPSRFVSLAGALENLLSQATQPGASLPAAKKAVFGELHPLRILVAEDNETNQKVATLTFKKLGYSIDIAADGRAAVTAARSASYDVIFMDVQMPEMDGYDATRAIRQQGLEGKLPGARPWVVALTASALLEDRDQCLEAGMDDFVTKPFSAGDLKRALLIYLNQRVASQPG